MSVHVCVSVLVSLCVWVLLWCFFMWCCLPVAVCPHAHSSVNPPSLPHTLYTHALPFTLPCLVLLSHCSHLFQRAAQQAATRTGLGLCDPQPMRCLTSTVRDLSHFGVFTLLCQFAHNSTHTTTCTAHTPRTHMHSPYTPTHTLMCTCLVCASCAPRAARCCCCRCCCYCYCYCGCCCAITFTAASPLTPITARCTRVHPHCCTTHTATPAHTAAILRLPAGTSWHKQ